MSKYDAKTEAVKCCGVAAPRWMVESLTAALQRAFEAGQATQDSLREALGVARETLESLRRRARDPMKSWDAGRCIESDRVEEDCDEALEKISAALSATPREPVTEGAKARNLCSYCGHPANSATCQRSHP